MTKCQSKNFDLKTLHLNIVKTIVYPSETCFHLHTIQYGVCLP